MLGRSPGLTMTAVLCLGLGIGATTTIFSVVNGALLRPFPYEKPDELALVWEQSNEEPASPGFKQVSYVDCLDCRGSSRAFRDMAIIGGGSCPLRYGNLFEAAHALEVTSNVFDLLGIQPALGRPFALEEEGKDRQQVAILTDECWSNWFQADPDVVGRSILLTRYGERSFTIVGVMPPGFLRPMHSPIRPDLLIPVPYEETQADRGARRWWRWVWPLVWLPLALWRGSRPATCTAWLPRMP
jgi:hypothetical protein